MKNRCQVFEKSIGLYIIVLITLFYSCAEDKGNYDYKAVNEVSRYLHPDKLHDL